MVDALRRRLIDEAEKEAAEELRALFLEQPFSALMRITLPGVLISSKRSTFDRGLENIRRNVLFPSTAKRRALTCSRVCLNCVLVLNSCCEEVALDRRRGCRCSA